MRRHVGTTLTSAMEGAAVWIKLSSLPLHRGLWRLLRIGVPSLIILGVLGLATWRWARRRREERRLLLPGGAAEATEEPSVPGTRQVAPAQGERNDARVRGSALTAPVPVAEPARTEPLTLTLEAPEFHPTSRHLGPAISSDIISEGFSEGASISSSASEEVAPLPTQHSSTDLIGKPIKRSSLIPATSSLPSFSSPRAQSPISPETDNFYNSQYKTTPPMPSGPKIKVAVQLPKDLVGRFIGKQGRNIKTLMLESGAYIYVNQKNLPEDALEVPCHIQGNSAQIDHALNIIASKFPTVDIPSWFDEGIASQSTNTSPRTPFASPPQNSGSEDWTIQLRPATVPPMSPFYAVVSYIESITRVWLVSCDSNPSLDDLHQQMSYYYSNSPSSSPPSFLLAALNITTGGEGTREKMVGSYCAVKVSDIHWLRGYVRQLSDDGVNFEVQLVDYGSTVIVPTIAIKPLLREHATMPIQAFPCVLANLAPAKDASEESLLVLQALVEGLVLEVHTTEALGNKACAPEVELYTQFGSQTPTFVNRELVDQGCAVWAESST